MKSTTPERRWSKKSRARRRANMEALAKFAAAGKRGAEAGELLRELTPAPMGEKT